MAPQHGPSGVYSTGGALSYQAFIGARPSLPVAVDRPEATATPRLGMALQAFLEAQERKDSVICGVMPKTEVPEPRWLCQRLQWRGGPLPGSRSRTAKSLQVSGHAPRCDAQELAPWVEVQVAVEAWRIPEAQPLVTLQSLELRLALTARCGSAGCREACFRWNGRFGGLAVIATHGNQVHGKVHRCQEWPSTQARNARALRENDYEDEKAEAVIELSLAAV